MSELEGNDFEIFPLQKTFYFVLGTIPIHKYLPKENNEKNWVLFVIIKV